MLARVVYQPARILVGYMQVITQIGLVLGFELPPIIQKVISTLKPLAMSIKGIIQLDCLGAIDFYQEWIVRVLVIPSVLVAIVSLRYSYEVRRGEATDAAGNLKANVFFIIFVLYPGALLLSVSLLLCYPSSILPDLYDLSLRPAVSQVSATKPSVCSTADSWTGRSACLRQTTRSIATAAGMRSIRSSQAWSSLLSPSACRAVLWS